MTSIATSLRKLLRDDTGATAVEYALIASAIAAVVVAIVFVVGEKTKNNFGNVNTIMP